MRYVLPTAAIVAAAIMFATTPALATPGAAVQHYNWSAMSLPERIKVQKHLIVVDWRIITRWRSAQLKERKLSGLDWSQVSLLLPAEPYTVTWHYRHMKWTQRELGESRRALARIRAAPTVPVGFPPHHALWVCIGSFEGSPTSDNGHGHYGLLQMHEDWYSLKGKANAYPQSVQEWAAEKAWKANGYSYSFLYDQWFAYDNADGCYSTA